MQTFTCPSKGWNRLTRGSACSRHAAGKLVEKTLSRSESERASDMDLDDTGHLSASVKDQSDKQIDLSVSRALSPESRPEDVIGVSRSQWLISPTVDLLFVCGFAPWLFGAATAIAAFNGKIPAPFKSGVPDTGPFNSLFLVVAALIIGESHQFTSIIRYYSRTGSKKQARKLDRFPIWVIYTGLIIIFGGIATGFVVPLSILASVVILPILMLAQFMFPVVLMQHVCAQAKAIGLIYCAKEGYKLSREEKYHLSAATWLLVFLGAFTIAAPFGISEIALNSGLIGSIHQAVRLCTFAELAYFAAKLIWRGLKNDEWLPAGAGWMWTNLILFVLIPFFFMPLVWLYVPIFFHATQHWVVAWITQKRENASSEKPATGVQTLKDFLVLVLPVQALSLSVLFLPLFLGSLVFGLNQGLQNTLSVGWSMLVFYMHYFSDRIVWRPQ